MSAHRPFDNVFDELERRIFAHLGRAMDEEEVRLEITDWYRACVPASVPPPDVEVDVDHQTGTLNLSLRFGDTLRAMALSPTGRVPRDDGEVLVDGDWHVPFQQHGDPATAVAGDLTVETLQAAIDALRAQVPEPTAMGRGRALHAAVEEATAGPERAVPLYGEQGDAPRPMAGLSWEEFQKQSAELLSECRDGGPPCPNCGGPGCGLCNPADGGVETATGRALDQWCELYAVPRQPGEDDQALRARLLRRLENPMRVGEGPCAGCGRDEVLVDGQCDDCANEPSCGPPGNRGAEETCRRCGAEETTYPGESTPLCSPCFSALRGIWVLFGSGR